jgi:epoxyqueuosine reductase QueG
LPLHPDSPLGGEIVNFCKSCTVCALHCPGEAISRGPLEIANGVARWVVDTEKCVPYFRDLGSCAICIQVCPWNGKALDGILRREWLEDTHRWRDLRGDAYRGLPVLQNQPNS